jgi:hypothetical protein
MKAEIKRGRVEKLFYLSGHLNKTTKVAYAGSC